MTRVTFEISDDIAERAKSSGLLNSETIEELLDRKANTCAASGHLEIADELNPCDLPSFFINGARKQFSFEELNDETLIQLIEEAKQHGIKLKDLAKRILNDALDCEPNPLLTSEVIDKIYMHGGGLDIEVPLCEPENKTPTTKQAG